VAVVGASDQPFSFGYHFLRHLLDYGFKGPIYPVNPQKQSLQGVKAYKSLSDVPGDVDLVICCVPTGRVLPLLEECPSKNVKVMHLFTARLSETGRPQALELERTIQNRARELGIRIIGPNCMGIYSPSSGIAFGYGFPRETGNIGVIFQSGGSATTLIQNGMLQGLRFSKVISYGNAFDIDESDIFEYLAGDPNTKVIAAYIEGVKDGQKLMRSLKKAAALKPVVAIKGGRGKAGTRAVMSHTAALAGSLDLWHTAFNQAGVIEAGDIDEMINLLVLFNCLPPIRGGRIGVMGGGGGKNVISADVAEEAGLSLPPFSDDMRRKLREMVPDLWDWVGNPVDFSIWGDSFMKVREIPGLFIESPEFDFLVIQVSDDNPMADDWWVNIIKMEVENIVSYAKQGRKPIVAIMSTAKAGYSDLENVRWKTIAEQRPILVDARIPVFENMAEAAGALNKYIHYWERR
jgi:acyl-CoA synthetase (NDP forming)